MNPRTKTLIGFGVVAVGLYFVPNLAEKLDAPGFYVTFLFTMFFWISQASSWNMLTGYTGYFSFGQGAFFGIGVYTTSILAGKEGWSFIAAVPMAGIVAGVFGLLLGLVVFRVRKLSGEIFALTTLAVAFVLASVARMFSFIDGGAGIFMTGTELPSFLGGDFRTVMYRMTLGVALATILASYLIYNSRVGWGMFAIRDDEEVAEGLGVPVFGMKMTALGANAFFGGLMGGVWSLQIGFVTVDDVFNLRVPLFVILMAVLGGMKHWMGPVVGAAIIYTFTDRLNSSGLEDINQILIGVLLIVLVLGVPEGMYLRFKARWIAIGIALLATFGVLTVLDLTRSLVWDFMWLVVLAMLIGLIPSSLWNRFSRSSPPPDEPTVNPDGEGDVVMEEAQS